MSPQLQRDLSDFRQAAQRRDPQQLHFLLKRLLQQLDYYPALAIVTERLYRFLDIFESYYPDEAWVRTLLMGVVSFGIAPDDSVAEQALQHSFTDPGAGNYLKAIYDLTQSMQQKHTGEARVGFMASAIVNVIMAELVEAWYGEREDAWETVRAAQSQAEAPDPDSEAAQIAYRFWIDAETAALDTACWLEVADHLSVHLARQTGETDSG